MANDFSVADVLAWARTKPADERYNFFNYRTCALAQFGLETGRPNLAQLGAFAKVPTRLMIALAEDEETFGALVKRLEAIVTPSVWVSPDAYRDVDVLA